MCAGEEEDHLLVSGPIHPDCVASCVHYSHFWRCQFPQCFYSVCLDSTAFAILLCDHEIHYPSVKRKDMTVSAGSVTEIHQKQSFSEKAGVSPSLTPR